jgi:predicted dehydrogenase
MGMIHYLAYQRLRGVKVHAVCEVDPVRRGGDWRTIKGNFGPPGELMDLSGVAQYADLDAMLADPALDLVDICLPTALHAPAAIRALAAGKHVLCEKPIALQPADGIAMVEAAGKAGRMLMIGHVLPFYPEYRFA